MVSKRDVKRKLVSICIAYLLCILALYFTHLFSHMHICLVQHVRICKDAEGHAYTLCILNNMNQLFIIGRLFLPTGHNATVNRLGLLSYIFPFRKHLFIYLLDNWHKISPKQGSLDPFLESKLWIRVLTHQSRVSSNSKELLVNIEPKMLGSIAHPKLPTT